MEMIDKWDLAESQQMSLEQGEVGDTVLGNCFGPCWWLGTAGSEIKSLIYFVCSPHDAVRKGSSLLPALATIPAAMMGA